MEIIVQKMVEIWISELSFFKSEHSQIDEIPENKKLRLEAIALEALEQSGNNIPIKIFYINKKNIQELLSGKEGADLIIASPGETKKLKPFINLSVELYVGPEWGWSEKEKAFFTNNNLLQWSFNDNVLRMETASIVGAGVLNYLLQVSQ
jgi:16S rRNA (uracil1498-N3)-methyltransferase